MPFHQSPRLRQGRMYRLTAVAFAALLNFAFPQQAVADAHLGFVIPNPSAQCLALDRTPPEALNRLPSVGLRKPKHVLRLTVTAYSSTVDQTDGDPFTTASGATVRDGVVAYNFLPFGTKVRFPDMFGDKVFVVEDRLNARSGPYHADIWMPTRADALRWGKRIIRMEIL